MNGKSLISASTLEYDVICAELELLKMPYSQSYFKPGGCFNCQLEKLYFYAALQLHSHISQWFWSRKSLHIMPSDAKVQELVGGFVAKQAC